MKRWNVKSRPGPNHVPAQLSQMQQECHCRWCERRKRNQELRDFLYQNLYFNSVVNEPHIRARRILEDGLALHPSEVSLRLELSRVYARLGKSDLAAEQTKIVEQLQAAQSR